MHLTTLFLLSPCSCINVGWTNTYTDKTQIRFIYRAFYIIFSIPVKLSKVLIMPLPIWLFWFELNINNFKLDRRLSIKNMTRVSFFLFHVLFFFFILKKRRPTRHHPLRPLVGAPVIIENNLFFSPSQRPHCFPWTQSTFKSTPSSPRPSTTAPTPSSSSTLLLSSSPSPTTPHQILLQQQPPLRPTLVSMNPNSTSTTTTPPRASRPRSLDWLSSSAKSFQS